MTNLLNQPDVWLLLREAFLRLKERSPKFFRVLQNVNYVIALTGAVPTLLTEFGVILPPNWATIVLKIVAFGGAWGVVMTKLTVTQPTKEVMPFSAKKQIEQEIKKEADNFQPPSGNNKTGL